MSQPLRILIVEDNEGDAVLLLSELQRGGYEPQSERVETPTAFHAALDRQEWDIIIADYSMPRFSGLEALRITREKGLDLPFILVSGTVGEETAVEVMKAGANDYLMKGKFARLCSAVERELREAGIRIQNRMADRLLYESEEKYRSLVENIPDVAWRADQHGRIVFISSNVKKICGWTPEEVYEAGPHLWPERIHADHLKQYEEGYKALFSRSQEFHVEYRLQAKDGRWIWIDDRAVATFERNGVRYADGVLSDVTKRKEAEAELQRFTHVVSHDLKELLQNIISCGKELKSLDGAPWNQEVRDTIDALQREADRAKNLLVNLVEISQRRDYRNLTREDHHG